MPNLSTTDPFSESDDHKLDTNETQLRSLFCESHLSSLDIAGYIDLIRTHPTHFLTHVTRQGVRDHTGSFHGVGLGEFHHGFENLLGNKKLQSRFSIICKRDGAEAAVNDLLEFNYKLKPSIILKNLGEYQKVADISDQARASISVNDGTLAISDTEETDRRMTAINEYAEKIVDSILSSSKDAQNGAGTAADMLAVHMAFEDVADGQYGGETGNEIFVVVPAMHVAADHQYNEFHQFTGYSEMWNDVWVWPKQDEGLNIDAGIVFIPKNTAVDPKSGSRYQMGIEGKPQIHDDYVELLTHGIFDLLQREEWERLYFLGSYPKNDGNDNERQNLRKKLHENASRAPGWSDKLNPILNDEEFIWNMINGIHLHNKFGESEKVTNVASKFLMRYKLYYVPAEQPISSQEYWEQYFVAHPDRRPSKIVYYEGDSPVQAMNDFRELNSIPTPQGTSYPFAENKIDKGKAVLERQEKLKKMMVPIVVKRIEEVLNAAA